MFYHAYRSYMDNAYPADELMPLSCQGRYRGVTPSRGDMDDILGKCVNYFFFFLHILISAILTWYLHTYTAHVYTSHTITHMSSSLIGLIIIIKCYVIWRKCYQSY